MEKHLSEKQSTAETLYSFMKSTKRIYKIGSISIDDFEIVDKAEWRLVTCQGTQDHEGISN